MKFKNIILITLLLLAIFTINSVSAADSNNTDELIANENYNSPDNIKNTNDLSNNNYDKSAGNEDNSNNNILSSSDSENSNDYTIKKIYETEVYLVKPINKNEAYILDSINKYPNTNTKFIIHINYQIEDTESGTVSLKFNGKAYSAVVYEGEAIIIAKTPSKVGKYKATLSYSGYTNVLGSDGYKYNPSSSTFTLNVKNPKTSVSAPKVTAYYKANKYFKISVKNKGKAVKNLKLNVKVYTGSKYKNYVIKTNKKGIAQLSTKKFNVGSHKVKITSKNSKYKVSKTSKIVIKKKSNIKTTTIKISEPNPYPNKKKLKTGDTLYAINSLGPQYGKGVYTQVIDMGQRIHTKILKVKFYFKNEYSGKIKTKIVTKIKNYNRYDGGESTAYTKFIPDYIPYKATVWYKKI